MENGFVSEVVDEQRLLTEPLRVTWLCGGKAVLCSGWHFSCVSCPTPCFAFFLLLLLSEGDFLPRGVWRAGCILALFPCCHLEPAQLSSVCAKRDPDAPPPWWWIPLGALCCLSCCFDSTGEKRRYQLLPATLPRLSHGVHRGERFPHRHLPGVLSLWLLCVTCGCGAVPVGGHSAMPCHG